MPNYTIQLATSDDAERLSAFAIAQFIATYADQNNPADSQAHVNSTLTPEILKQGLLDEKARTLLVIRDAQLLAYAQIRFRDKHALVTQHDAVELQRFYVAHSEHGNGLAHTLMREAQQHALTLCGQYLWLSAWERNPRAMAFYLKLGFIDMGVTDFYVGSDRQTDHILVARL
jgi:diamine N-acetyltransferase